MADDAAQATAGVPLLATKLYAPTWRPGLVSRPRLIARLEVGTGRALTLVSAPAGFGKSTLLAEWLAGREQPAAWLSLDPADNDPARFWSYLIAALQRVRPEIGASALALLRASRPAPIEAVLTHLINDLAGVGDETVLVLDDHHVIESQPIHEGLAFLLDRRPPGLRLVIAGRADPPLPLARLRARAELAELRAAEIRFTPEEAAAFLNQAMGLALSAEDVATLEARTEGWIAGLQLAALSLQGRADPRAFVRAFAGADRYILDYLVDEVLRRQPAPTRDFLLDTAILDRLSGPLCDAVTGRSDGAATLEALERANLFVVPLDDTRQWFRYHHLFADVLAAHLLAERPERLPDLHARASRWHERHGSTAEAIRHALAAHETERAAMLIELAVPAMRRSRQDATVLGWLKALPVEAIHRRPVLDVGQAWAMMAGGDLAGAEARLSAAERRLEQSDDLVVADEDEKRRVPATIAIYRAGIAQLRGDAPTAAKHAERALALVPPDDDLVNGAAEALLGLAAWAQGDLEAARQRYGDGMARVLRAGNISDSINGAVNLADILTAQGKLREAMAALDWGLRLAAEQGEPAPQGTADVHVAMSELSRERGELDRAAEHLRVAKEVSERTGLPHDRSRRQAAMARLRAAEGDPDGELALLGEAERLQEPGFTPNARPPAAMKARAWVARGQLAEAQAWARSRGLSADDDLSYLRAFEHLALARLLLALGQRDRDEHARREGLRLLDRLIAAAESRGWTGVLIETLVAQALAHGNGPRGLAALERALLLAEPEGYVRLFIDEGEPMQTLLRQVTGDAAAYARRPLAGFAEPSPPSSAQSSSSALREPLTAREIEVLRLVAAGLRNQEIADRLYISLATVKRHIANAYGKLGAGHRTEALLRANELNLL